MEILAILKPVKLPLNWGWDFSSELQCSTYFSDLFSLFSLFRTHIATTENSVWAIILCHGPVFPKKWNSLRPHENGLHCHRWHHQWNMQREYLKWHRSLLSFCHILLSGQFLLKAYGRNYHNHLSFSLLEQLSGWSTGRSQEKNTTADSLYIATRQSCTTDVSRAKLQGGRLDGSGLGVRRLSARSPQQPPAELMKRCCWCAVKEAL